MKKEEKVRVLHVLGAMNQGGVENSLINLYRNIEDQNFQFDFGVNTKEQSFFDEEIKARGGNVYLLGNNKNIVKYCLNLYTILKNNVDIKVVHSHVHYFSGIVLFIAYMARKPIRIAHSHSTQQGIEVSKLRRVYQNIMRKMIYLFSTDQIGCSQDTAVALFGDKSLRSKKTHIIYNGIDLDKFNKSKYNVDELKKSFGLKSEDKQFVYVGRLAKEKNITFMLDVFYELSKINKDINLTIVGDGDQKDKIKNKINEYKLNEKVKLLGQRTDIPEILSIMEYVIFPSLYEGFSVALLEFQAMELNCFISDTISFESNLGLCNYLSLKKGSKYWAIEIDKFIKKGKSLVVEEDKIKEIDIHYIIKKLNDIYYNKKGQRI